LLIFCKPKKLWCESCEGVGIKKELEILEKDPPPNVPPTPPEAMGIDLTQPGGTSSKFSARITVIAEGFEFADDTVRDRER
jgi:hypothetical protein